MSRARRLAVKARIALGSLRTQYEYARARSAIHDGVASTPSDSDEGIHIRGPFSPGMEEPDEVVTPNVSRRKNFGRRANDLNSDHIITKRLVVVTVILVDALYLAGDALLNGTNVCP